jgi:hypothetical protein
MEVIAKTIKTPVGIFNAPLNPGFKETMAELNTEEDLFALVDVGGFICPDAFNEVLSRGIFDKYKAWKNAKK